ncbi:MAG: alpha/beta hydrolase [Planctomycetia bacterium]|nr:alpha/beta hydrolase [Planctomycetia bacterium]
MKHGRILCGVLALWVLCVSASGEDFQAKPIKNIVYKTVDGKELKLNLFLPVKGEKRFTNVPLLIFIDAGCWYSGEPGSGGMWGGWGAIQRGFAVASVPHRSAKEVPFPAQIEDTKAAIRFLRAHADAYGIDKTRFAVMGCSSGGHISCMLGIPDQVRTFDVGENLDQSSQVQRVINFYGPTDLKYMLENSHCIPCIYQTIAGTGPDGKIPTKLTPEQMEHARVCSPMAYVSRDFAPTLNLYGVMDRTVPISQGVRFYEALYRAGVRTEMYVSNRGVHSVKSIADNETLAAMVFKFLEWDGVQE